MSIGDTTTTGTITFPYPYDSTAGDVFIPDQPEWKQPWTTPSVTWPPVPQHPAELESFEEFVIWACGFTDPEHPPSQAKWEEFQEKVRQLAADFVEYKRARREAERLNQPYQTWSTTTTSAANF